MAFPLLIPALVASLKALLVPLLSVLLYYVLFKFLGAVLGVVVDWALSQIMTNTDLGTTTIQLTGFSAWLMDTLDIANTIGILMSFLVTRFIIKMVRG